MRARDRSLVQWSSAADGQIVRQRYNEYLTSTDDVADGSVIAGIYDPSTGIDGDKWRVSTRASGEGGHTMRMFSNIDGSGSGLTNGTWDVNPFRLGAHWLWVDTSFRLRIKTSTAPTSDTDGVVVGTQT